MSSDKAHSDTSDLPSRERSAEPVGDERDILDDAETPRENASAPRARRSSAPDRPAQTAKSQTTRDGSSKVKRDVAVGGAAAVGLAGFAAGAAAYDPTHAHAAAAPTEAPPAHETAHLDASHIEAAPPMAEEIASPGPSEIMLISDELIDDVDLTTDGALDGVAILPAEEGLEHVEQVRDDMNPSLDHWIMPMDEDTSDDPVVGIGSYDAEIIAADGELVAAEIDVPVEDIAPVVVDEVLVVETEYQSPSASLNDAWILASDTPAEVIAVDDDSDPLGNDPDDTDAGIP
jgi:hypothetical protein